MSGHATAEVLSAYIDQELSRPQLRLVETHIEACEECRERLRGLRRVVGQLHRLETVAPPPVLAQQVQRRIALDGGRPKGLVERLERRLGGLPLEPSVAVTFALVFSFAVILYLFGWWVGDRGGTTVLVPPISAEANGSLVEVDGRLFELEGDLWVERGLDPQAPVRTVTVAEAEGLALLERYPRFVNWLVAGRSVRLVLETGEAVQIEPPPVPDPRGWEWPDFTPFPPK
jgi:hypothetical protein